MAEQPFWCSLCRKASILTKNEVEADDYSSSSEIINLAFRLLDIKDSFPLLDAETGLLIPTSFCASCKERAKTLENLFNQLDAINQCLSELRDTVERDFIGEFSDNNHGNDLVKDRSPLGQFITDRIHRQNLATETPDFFMGNVLESIIDDNNSCYSGENTIYDDDETENSPENLLQMDSDGSMDSVNEAQSNILHVFKRPLPNPYIRVVRLTAQEIDRHTKRNRKEKIRGEMKDLALQILVKAKGKQAVKEAEAVKPLKSFKCPYETCTRITGFDSETLLHCHVSKKHKGETHPYQCQDCNRKFRQPKQYELHMQSHKGDFPIICSFCGQGFTCNFALKIHEAKHTGELIYKCSQCPRAFKGHSGLSYHIKMKHTNERSFICDHCGKLFVNTEKLKRHVLAVHRPERPEVCHLCGKTFPIRNYLRMHIRSVHEKHVYPGRVKVKHPTRVAGLALGEALVIEYKASPSSSLSNIVKTPFCKAPVPLISGERIDENIVIVPEIPDDSPSLTATPEAINEVVIYN